MANVPVPNDSLTSDVNLADQTLTQVQTDVPGSTLTTNEQSSSSASASDSATGTGSGNAAAITVPDGRSTVTIAYDTSDAANITVEVSPNGGTDWYPIQTYSPGSAANSADTISVGFDDVRVYIDSNLNSLHIGAKGV